MVFAGSGSFAAGQRPIPEEAAAVLGRRCLSCHSAEKRTGGVDLSTRKGAQAAGAVGPDDPAKNRLVQLVTGGKMPPSGRLPAAEIAVLRSWARAGTVYPQEPLHEVKVADQPLWSLEPIRQPVVPHSPYDALARNPIDRFLFAKLAEKGLKPSPPAGKLQLLRRVTIDLTGLPPTPKEIAAFLADRSPDAYEKVVDRLLASPAYGECWGQHWLDVVRYGDSHGYEQNHLRRNAWPYRDYVIHALNQDLPFDRFVTEQLAGDVVGKGDPWSEAATGFLVAGVHDTVGNQTEEGTRQQRANDLDDMVCTTAETFLGLTVGCAKCHDHKFDPIPQKDYYRLAAVFAGVRHGERVLGSGAAGSKPGAEARFRETFPPTQARYVRMTIFATNDGSEPCLDEVEIYDATGKRNLALAANGTTAMASSLLPGYAIHQIPHLIDGQLGNDHSWISNERGKGWVQINLPETATISRLVWSRDGTPQPRFHDRTPSDYQIEVSLDGRSWRILSSHRGVTGNRVGPGIKAYAGQFGDAEPIYLLRRGDVMQRVEPVAPGAPSRLGGLSGELFGTPPPSAAPGGNLPPDPERRLAFAHWLTDPKNPLTARVIVNRVWHYHFGRGIVATPSDFGHNGEPPTHPELLDWLASSFAAGAGGQESGAGKSPHSLTPSPNTGRGGTDPSSVSGQRATQSPPSIGGSGGHPVPDARTPCPGMQWSLKKLHRLIVTSSAYRQSSAGDPKGLAVDAGDQLLWRMPLRRMDAEAARDAVLATSGKLDRQMGGPGFGLFKYREVNVAIYEPLDTYGPETWRRSVYRLAARAIHDDLLYTLDCPESAQRTPRRPSTTTALQALSLLNGSFMLQQAGFFADRIRAEAPLPPAQVERAFQLAFGRSPHPEEVAAATELVRKDGLTALCRALLNANEFLYY